MKATDLKMIHSKNIKITLITKIAIHPNTSPKRWNKITFSLIVSPL